MFYLLLTQGMYCVRVFIVIGIRVKFNNKREYQTSMSRLIFNELKQFPTILNVFYFKTIS